MRFEIIMHMPTRGGIDKISEPVHRLVVDHPSKSLEEFVHVLMNYDFVIVEEFYPGKFTKEYESHGLIALNHRYVGKIKQWDRKQ
jgi:hypothetical protein